MIRERNSPLRSRLAELLIENLAHPAKADALRLEPKALSPGSLSNSRCSAFSGSVRRVRDSVLGVFSVTHIGRWAMNVARYMSKDWAQGKWPRNRSRMANP